MRILIAIGCNSYTRLSPLLGAEEDAQRIWSCLIGNAPGTYSEAASAVLLSPTLDEVRIAFRSVPDGVPIDALTFYFAGHGGIKAGSYYFCVTDSQPEKLSSTALPLSEVLGIVTELKPRQANLVFDACQSGGGMYDFSKVLREDALEQGASLGISVLAACGTREIAAETAAGGFATSQLLRYLDGGEQLQCGRPFLDLVEVGRAVSADLARRGSQTPVVWGINLTGAPEFALNPHFDPASSPATAAHLPASTRRGLIAKFGDRITRLHAETREEASGRDIVHLLTEVVAEIERQGQTGLEFIAGVGNSLIGAALESRDLFAPTIVIDSALATVLAAQPRDAADALIAELLDKRRKYAEDLIQPLLDTLKEPHYAFLNHTNVAGDLFYLPIRVTGVLGWCGALELLGQTLGAPSAGTANQLRNVATAVLEHYPNAIVAMADRQATDVFVFSEACRLVGLDDVAETVLACLYTDLIDTRACVARRGLEGRSAFRFLQERAARPHQVLPRLRASPSDLLTTVLVCAAVRELDDLYDFDLAELDHRTCNLFVPVNYDDFGQERIANGANYGFDIGQLAWTLQDVRNGFRTLIPAIEAAAKGMSEHRLAAAMLASQVLPDRLPLFLSLVRGGGDGK